MRHLLGVSLLCLCAACSTEKDLTPAQFTREFAQALSKASPGLKVEIVDDLQLKVVKPDGGEFTSFLDNAYDAYKQDPEAKDAVIERFVASAVETVAGSDRKIDRTRIVPVVKDRPWLDEMRRALAERGAKDIPDHACDDLNADLIIVYAEDTPSSIRYLTSGDVEELGVERDELRTLACANLKRLLPEIERHGAGGVYMLTAGGNYEASLLLIDSVWAPGQLEVRGETVVAIPTRDLLLVTGSEDAEGLRKVRSLARQSFGKGPYPLTPKLFVYRQGKLAEFTEPR